MSEVATSKSVNMKRLLGTPHNIVEVQQNELITCQTSDSGNNVAAG